MTSLSFIGFLANLVQSGGRIQETEFLNFEMFINFELFVQFQQATPHISCLNKLLHVKSNVLLE